MQNLQSVIDSKTGAQLEVIAFDLDTIEFEGSNLIEIELVVVEAPNTGRGTKAVFLVD